MRNADAHLKNYAVTYTSFADVALAPVYDIVTVTAYPAYQDSLPGLTLGGKKVWKIGKLLHQFGATRLSLPAYEMAACLTEVTSAINEMVPILGQYASTYPGFRETAKRMLTEWELGVQDIQAQATSKVKSQIGFKAIAGLSDETDVAKKVNAYKNPDGGFSHKAR